MSTTTSAESCRITVFGPNGRADLAVPMTVSVASLLPALLRRTAKESTSDGEPGIWVLQRLGEGPLDPNGTPESLDWRHGEELHLRPAADPLPELDFDDLADGIAVSTGRRSDRWRPELNRWLFLGLATLTLLVIAWTVVGLTTARPGAAALIAAGLFGGSLAGKDHAVRLFLGLTGCAFAEFSAVLGGKPAGGLVLTAAAATLIVGHRLRGTGDSFVPYGIVAAAGALCGLATWLHGGLSWTRTAGVLAAGMLAVVIIAPRPAIRLARLRGPQLPRTAEELQADTAPLPAAEVIAGTARADGYLTVATVSAALTFGAALPVLAKSGPFPAVLAVLVATAALLRARALLGIWQRVALTLAGAIGLAAVALTVTGRLSGSAAQVWLAVLAGVFGVLLLAVLRPAGRRLLPIWGHLANGLETLTAVAVLPVLLQLFDVYARARGLAG